MTYHLLMVAVPVLAVASSHCQCLLVVIDSLPVGLAVVVTDDRLLRVGGLLSLRGGHHSEVGLFSLLLRMYDLGRAGGGIMLFLLRYVGAGGGGGRLRLVV